MTNTATTDESPDNVRERLLKVVKKEVKQIMEESVTKKFIHEESSPIMTLCGAIEACIQHGLKKRALGLFKNSTTSSALLAKISKQCDQAATVVKVTAGIEQSNESARKSAESLKNGGKKVYNTKHLWIRVALIEKLLAQIMDYLVSNAKKYYEKEALIADPCDGPILAQILVGPCALDYTKMKTADHYWLDPPADELIQRHRIHSSGNHHIRPDSPKRPGLHQIAVGKRHTSSSSEESPRSVVVSAREYVESLHQNNKTQLLYGKNNVIVQPKEDVEPLAGYLSLHQGGDGLSIKWTPNQLMNGCSHDDDEAIDRSLYWDYAVTIYLDEIVYLHCHQQPDSGGTIVLVGQDGVQRPPIHFPRGGHLLAFLSCLETGLLPHGQLDPPLWSQRGKGKVFPKMKRKGSQMKMGSVTSSQGSTSQGSSVTSGGSVTSQGSGSIAHECGMKSQDSLSVFEDCTMNNDEVEATDYVFRIVSAFKPHSLPAEVIDPKAKSNGSLSSFAKSAWPIRGAHAQLRSTLSLGPVTPPPAAFTPPSVPQMDTMQIYAKSQQQFNNSCISKNGHRTAVKQLCDTMKNQILSRAFYGWLSYVRHLKTVRTHLSGLVNITLVPVDVPYDASGGLTVEKWHEMCKDGSVTEEQEIYRLVYFGGCASEIRYQVWPYLLGHYTFGSTEKQRSELDVEIQQRYERTMSEWLAVEAIVKQRNKEIMAANLAKLSMESQDGHIPLMRKDSSLSNDVFESIDSEDFSHPETVPEETSSQLVTPTGEEEKHPLSSAIIERLQQKTDDKGDTGSTSVDEGIGTSVSTSNASKPSTTSTSEPRTSGSLSDETGARVKTPGGLSDETAMEADKTIIVTQATIESVSSCHGSRSSYHSTRSAESHDKSEADEDSSKLLSTSSNGGDISPASNASNGGVYSPELIEEFGMNIHRIDKDVQRCDRNYSFFTLDNLDKLRNVMCTYVWENLEIGYVQGMCDLLAPLLVILNDEAKAYSCFCQLMKRMNSNFPHGNAMDQHFANMRSLIQILDPEIFEYMHENGDYTHFYFCYRWFLLDFKRELLYEDVFKVWETIWVAKHISSPHFVLFIALALVECYREIIIDNNMDFTDIIKFFNEMAERHNAKQVLRVARDLVYRLQDLIENK